MRCILSRLLFLCTVAVSQLWGSYDAYLWIEGIEGESRVEERNDWIDVTSVSHGLSRSGAGAAQHSDVVLIKSLDSASPFLNLHCANGTVIPEAILDFVRQDGEATRFYRLFLRNVTVSFVELQGSAAGEILVERIGLNFNFVEWTYTEFATTGEMVGEHIAYWNVTLGRGGIRFRDVPPPWSGDLGFRATLKMLDGDGGTANLSWTSTAGKTYEIYFSPTLDGPFDQLVATVPSIGDGITSTTVELYGNRGFFVIRELD